MSVYFAAADTSDRSIVGRVLRCPAVRFAHNDNGPVLDRHVPDEVILRAALRHFAEHGLGAARAARMKAQEAFFAGDRASYDWWLSITRTLDRRLATESVYGEIAPVRGDGAIPPANS